MIKRIKRGIVLLLDVSIVFTISACGSSTPSRPPVQEETVTTPSSHEEFINEDEQLANELKNQLANGICTIEDIQNMYQNGEISEEILYVLGIEVPHTQSEYSGEKRNDIKIVSLAACSNHLAGLKIDGTVITDEHDIRGSCDVSGWKNIVALAVSGATTIGLRDDGTVIATGGNELGQCDVSDWTNIIAIAAGSHNTAGLKEDGSVVVVGENINKQCNVEN